MGSEVINNTKHPDDKNIREQEMNLESFENIDMVLVCGLPGSGKSHFAKKYFYQKRERINRKELRRLLFEMSSFGDKWNEEFFDDHDEFLVKHVERKICEHYLHNKKMVLIDNNSVSADSRKAYIATAKQMNKSIGVIFLNTPLSKCLARNQNNEDCIPSGIITNLYASINIPKREEGFKQVVVVDDY